jgi:hypothetical protein
MSARNGDRSRFQINRKRKLLRRQRIRAALAVLRAPSTNVADRGTAQKAPR